MKRNCAHRSFSEFSIGVPVSTSDIFEFERRKQVDVVAHHAIRCEYQLETSEELPGMIGGHDDATVIFNH